MKKLSLNVSIVKPKQPYIQLDCNLGGDMAGNFEDNFIFRSNDYDDPDKYEITPITIELGY